MPSILPYVLTHGAKVVGAILRNAIGWDIWEKLNWPCITSTTTHPISILPLTASLAQAIPADVQATQPDIVDGFDKPDPRSDLWCSFRGPRLYARSGAVRNNVYVPYLIRAVSSQSSDKSLLIASISIWCRDITIPLTIWNHVSSLFPHSTFRCRKTQTTWTQGTWSWAHSSGVQWHLVSVKKLKRWSII